MLKEKKDNLTAGRQWNGIFNLRRKDKKVARLPDPHCWPECVLIFYSTTQTNAYQRVQFCKCFLYIWNKSNRKTAFYKATGNVEYNEYYPKKSKEIIDEIDAVLSDHYDFT